MLNFGIIEPLVLLSGCLELSLDLRQLILILLLLLLLLQYELLCLLLCLLDLLLCARHLSDHPRHLLLAASLSSCIRCWHWLLRGVLCSCYLRRVCIFHSHLLW